MKPHQPYEAWIFEEDLSQEEQQRLTEHLSQCEACRSLREKWLGTQTELQERSMAVPRAGFTQRWKTSLVVRKQREQKKQAWRVFWIFSGVASGVMAGVFTYFLTQISLAGWLELSVEMIHQVLGVTSSIGGVLSAWTHLYPFPLTLFMVLLFLLSLLGLIALWLFALSRTFQEGKERA